MKKQENMANSQKKMSKLTPRDTDSGLTRQSVQINCLKYAHRTKGNHVKRIKRKYNEYQ